MNIDDIPDLKGERYPERVLTAVSTEAKAKLNYLKHAKRKDTSTLVRMLIDKFLEGVDVDPAELVKYLNKAG